LLKRLTCESGQTIVSNNSAVERLDFLRLDSGSLWSYTSFSHHGTNDDGHGQ